MSIQKVLGHCSGVLLVIAAATGCSHTTGDASASATSAALTGDLQLARTTDTSIMQAVLFNALADMWQFEHDDERSVVADSLYSLLWRAGQNGVAGYRRRLRVHRLGRGKRDACETRSAQVRRQELRRRLHLPLTLIGSPPA